MKSKILFAFAIVAAFSAVLLSGCGEDGTTTPPNNCVDINGDRDTGAHTVYIGVLPAPLTPIRDTLDATVVGNTVTIHTMSLNRNLTGTIDAADCNKVNLDSVIFAPGDTLVINSSTLGRVTIWDIRAGGSGVLTTTGVTTSIKIAKGKTNITSPINLTNLNGLGLELKGNFKTL